MEQSYFRPFVFSQWAVIHYNYRWCTVSFVNIADISTGWHLTSYRKNSTMIILILMFKFTVNILFQTPPPLAFIDCRTLNLRFCTKTYNKLNSVFNTMNRYRGWNMSQENVKYAIYLGVFRSMWVHLLLVYIIMTTSCPLTMQSCLEPSKLG